MQKRFFGEYPSKAKKREIKKRPKMKISSRALKQISLHAGKKLSSRK